MNALVIEIGRYFRVENGAIMIFHNSPIGSWANLENLLVEFLQLQIHELLGIIKKVLVL